MNEVKTYFRTHPRGMKLAVQCYIIFCGCFAFPFSNGNTTFESTKAYMLIVSYGIIAFAFSWMYETCQIKLVYGSTLSLTAVGMFCAYLLEFGEVSNTTNFTMSNIVSYIVIIPIMTTMLYYGILKKEDE